MAKITAEARELVRGGDILTNDTLGLGGTHVGSHPFVPPTDTGVGETNAIECRRPGEA